MKFWSNVVGYQTVWFSAVIGAGRELWWPACAAAAAFVLLHFAFAHRSHSGRVADLKLMAVALAIGLLLDGGLAASGLARYAANGVSLPPGGAPLWLLAIWASFALTLRHSMTFLSGRPLVALIFGAIGGPLAYLGAARGWQAIAFDEPRWPALLALAVGWGIAMPLLATLAARWSRPRDTPTSNDRMLPAR